MRLIIATGHETIESALDIQIETYIQLNEYRRWTKAAITHNEIIESFANALVYFIV